MFRKRTKEEAYMYHKNRSTYYLNKVVEAEEPDDIKHNLKNYYKHLKKMRKNVNII